MQTKSKQKKQVKKIYNPKAEFLKAFEHLRYHHNSGKVWQDFITMFACAISNSIGDIYRDQREFLYMNSISKYKKSEQQIFTDLAAATTVALAHNPAQDFLGDIYSELNLTNKDKGQFFTPYHVCELMAKINLIDVLSVIQEQGYATVFDGCCGAGAILIAAANETRQQLANDNKDFRECVRFIGQDIDQTVAFMCYIQLSLIGASGFVKVGDSFSDPIKPGDTFENYWFTPNYYIFLKKRGG